MEQSNRRQDTGGRKGMPKRMLALALAFAMVFTSFDLPVLAEGAAQSAAASVSAESTAVPVSTDAAAGTQAPAQSAEPVTAEDSATLTVTADPEQTATAEPTAAPTAEPTAEPTATPTAEPAAAFAQSAVVDGVTITVTADPGVLPADAVLQASRITDAAALADYTQAVDAAAPAAVDAAKAEIYAFDITLLDANGEKIEPNTAKGEVRVAFTNPDPEKWDVSELSLYHVDEAAGTAQELDTLGDEAAQTVAADAPGFSPFVLMGIPSQITLYTGCGTITDTNWTQTAACAYQGSNTAFPTPVSADATLSFEGWFADSGYQTAALAPAPGGTYYAKWKRVLDSYDNGSYKYWVSSLDKTRSIWTSENTLTYMQGINTGSYPFSKKYLYEFDDWVDGGINARYVMNSTDPSGFGTLLQPAVSGEDVFVQVSGNLYVAQVPSIEGNFVRYSYYIWNRGSADVTNFNLAVSAIVDGSSIWYGEDAGGSYISTEPTASFANRLYYSGPHITVPADTEWIGPIGGPDAGSNLYRFPRQTYMQFESGEESIPQNYYVGMALSWQRVTVPANTVVVRDFLVGVGSESSLMLDRNYSYDADGDGVLEPEHKTMLDVGVDTVIAPAAPARDGYYFLGWNTAADGSGTMYQAGDTVDALNKSVALYSQWDAIPNIVNVALTLDGAPWSGQTVQLAQDKTVKYTLDAAGTEGAYQSVKVIRGNYDIYVNGRKSDQTILVDSIDKSIEVSGTAAYKNVSVTTRLDGTPSGKLGTVTLRKAGLVVYTMQGADGLSKEILQDSEGDYEIYADGCDTGYALSGADPDRVIDFVTATVRITDDAPWENARITLQNTTTDTLAAVLAYTSTEGKTTVYTKYVAQNDAARYEVFAEGKPTHKFITQNASGCEAELLCYTAKANVKGEVPSPAVSMTNGTETYDFTGANGVYTAYHVPYATNADGSEKTYTVTTANTIDTKNTQISIKNKEVTLQYWTVTAYDYAAADLTTLHLFSKQYVRDGCAVPKIGTAAKRVRYSFSCWSETRWTANAMANTPFDFTQKLARSITLYANYDAPSLKINSLVYTNAQGTAGGNGAYYRMGNLSIRGFDEGEEAIKTVLLTMTNADSIQLLNTANVTVRNGQDDIATNGGAVTFVPSKDRIAIVFTTPLPMSQAQDYLRTQIVVKPTQNQTHTIKMEITDADNVFRAANKVSSAQTTMSMTQITSGTSYLGTGNYYVDGYVSIYCNYGDSGIGVSGTANIYFLPGSTLRVQGRGASGTAGGGAGIYLLH